MAALANESVSLEANKIKQLREDITEMQQLLENATREKVKQLILMDIRRLETEVTNLQQTMDRDSEQKIPSTTKEPSRAGPVVSNVKIINYAWDQSEKFVKLYVTLNDVHTIPAENVQTEFSPNSVDLQVLGLDNRNHQLKITKLLKLISPQDSHHKVKRDTVVVFLRKTSPENWTYMTALEQKSKEPKMPKTDEDPNESLMSLMKKMYNEGDDEMKRTIAKAWTEARTKSATGEFGP